MPRRRSTRRFISMAAAGLLTAAMAPSAAADETNPAVIACNGKAEGDACTFTRMVKSNEGQPEKRESPGVCQTDECCEQDYSKGSPPEVTCGPCLACKSSGPLPTPDAPEVTASGGTPPAEGGGEPPRTSSDPPAATPNDKRGCSVQPRRGGQPLWALTPLLLLWLRRRG